MIYALKTADNSGLFLEKGQPYFVADPAVPAEYWPVDETIHDGFIRTGWTLEDGVCKGVFAAAPPVPVPDSVPAWRVKAVADALELTPQIEAVIDSLPVPQRYAVRRSWTDGNEIERHAQSTVAIGAALGLTSEQLDQMFRDAAGLVV